MAILRIFVYLYQCLKKKHCPLQPTYPDVNTRFSNKDTPQKHCPLQPNYPDVNTCFSNKDTCLFLPTSKSSALTAIFLIDSVLALRFI
jgi:hypothetical protein